ncbi:hypothetical protein FRC08_016810 [Ceratobasidium sp. 394]|nr:hypothetical protein FRC08_016810 [Ceratobasidium sp. 394]
MPITRLSRQREARQRCNSVQPVNKLPDEILVNVFLLCVYICENTSYSYYTESIKDEGYQDYACQTAVSAVCHRWRALAIRTPQLWSDVTLSGTPPWDRSALYLARSGSTAPLDVGIDMTEDYWNTENEALEVCVERAQKALEFIVSHGGVTSRWRSVSITTEAFGPHRVVVDFLRSSPLPELQSLMLSFDGPSELDEEDTLDLVDTMYLRPMPLFQDPPPKLHTVHIGGLSNPFLFGHSNQLQLPGLTHLRLHPICLLPPLSDFRALLAATTGLVSLHLDLEMAHPTKSHNPDLYISKVQLPHLREFGLYAINETYWPLNVLKMLEAPNVEELQVGRVSCEASIKELVHYLADGGNKSTPQPVFPSVNYLWLSLAGVSDSTALLKTLLHAYPRITRLDIPFIPLDALLVKPWLARNLQHLRATEGRGSDFRKLVAARARAKLPLKVLETDIRSGHLIKPADRKYLSSKLDFRFLDMFGPSRPVGEVDSEEELWYQNLSEEED